MDNNSIRETILSALAIGVFLVKCLKSRNHVDHEIVNQDLERESYINIILFEGEQKCVDVIRMRPSSFFKLCDLLTSNNLLHSSRGVSVREQLLIFLHIIGHNVRLRVIGSRYYRSTETVHRYFRSTLRAILRLQNGLIALPDGESIPHEIISNPRFYPYFKDCVGVIDGSHVRASVPLAIQGRFCGRKGVTTQNVFAAITFDLRFCYVLAGWEGSAHDSRVLNDALTRSNRFKIPKGKYYLGDAGYGIRKGIPTPYRGVRYHLKEFSNHRPENAKELFNLRHSSLRTSIERVFGILKKRFCVLDAEPFWDFQTQVDIVIACCLIHNHIMGVDHSDIINQESFEDNAYDNDDDLSRVRSTLTQREERQETQD